MEYGSILTGSSMGKEPDPKKETGYKTMQVALARRLYFFVDKKSPGIMVYDYTGDKIEGEKKVSTTYETATFDERRNDPDKIKEELYPDAVVQNETIFVTAEQLELIKSFLTSEREKGKYETIINISKLLRGKTYENVYEKYDLDNMVNDMSDFDMKYDEETNYNRHTK